METGGEPSTSRGTNETFYSYSVLLLSTMRIVSILPFPVLEAMQKKLGASSWFPFLFPLSVFPPFIFVFNILGILYGSLARNDKAGLYKPHSKITKSRSALGVLGSTVVGVGLRSLLGDKSSHSAPSPPLYGCVCIIYITRI